jgi:hypothetical protein
MPNNITNVICINNVSDARLAEILAAIRMDDVDVARNSIDFNKLIPMPPELDVESSTRSTRALDVYTAFVNESRALAAANAAEPMPTADYEQQIARLTKKNTAQAKSDPELFSFGKQLYENIQNHGYEDWYGWRQKHWGSKWASYGFDELAGHSEGNEIEFLTAWSRVEPILKCLSEMFPDAEFSYYWADEDMGVNVGQQIWENGEMTEEYIPAAHSNEAYELAAEIRSVSLEELGYLYCEEKREYVYIDPDEGLDEENNETEELGGMTLQ